MAETDAVELDLYDLDLTTKLGTLPAVDVGLYFELNQPGSGNCKVHTLRSLASGMVEQGQFVRVKYRGAVQGGFFVEDIGKNEASQGESADLWTPIQGRGPMKMFESAMVWSDGTDASTRDFAEQPKAAMLIALIDEAKARGGLAVVDYDFTSSVDSNGDAWTDAEAMQFSVGKTLLDVCREISDFGIDTNMTVNEDGTFTLQAFANGKGSDKSTTIYFRRGVNCTEITVDGRGMDFANALLIKHENGFVTVTDNDSIATHGRVEKMIDAHDAGNSDNALRYGQALLALKKDPKKEVSMQMYDGVSPYVFTDYDTGDWVTKDISGVEEVLRVRSITLSWTDAEKADVTVGLNSLVIENEIKQQNDIRKLYEMIRRQNDGKEVTLPFWAAIGKLSSLATDAADIYAIAVSDAGIMYVGGSFTKIGNVTVGNAARYNIKTGEWSALGTGFDASVSAIACDGTKVYFGGSFTTADGVPCLKFVARWDEDAETFDATGADGSMFPVLSLAVSGTRVYIGGTGDAPEDGGDYKCVGYLDTSDESWHEMLGIIGEGSIDANTLDVNDTKVFLGTGGVGNGVLVYSWDISGETWTAHAVHYGLDSADVYAVKLHGDYLYIGGLFPNLTTPFPDLEDIPDTLSIARMNLGTEIVESFDGGFVTYPDDVVRAFHVSGADLYIGGNFSVIGSGSLAASNIAKWNNGLFSMLGTGLNDECHAITSYNGNIGAGGIFTQAGGKPIKFVGAYITSLEELVNYLETGGGAETGGGYTHPNHSGDVVSAGDGAQTIQSNAVDNTKLADMAEGTVKARTSAGSGDPEDVTFEDLLTAMGVPGAQTAKRVIISDASGVIGTTEALIYDDTAKTLSLGTTDAGSGVPNILTYLANGISTIFNMFTWGAGLANRIKGVFARGTKSAPSAALTDDVMLKVSGAGYDGTTAMGSAATSGEFRIVANENQAAGAHGTRIEIWLAPNGSATMVKVGELTEDGLRLETGFNLYMADDSKIDFGNGNYEMLQDNSVGGFDFGPANLKAGYFTVTTKILPTTNGGAAIGQPSPLFGFSGFYLSNGGVINWNNGAVVLTQSGSVLTLSAGSFSGRIKKREVLVTQSATPAINTDNGDIFTITGLAQAITSLTTNLTGTPAEGDMIELQITDNGTARAITHGASFVSTTANAMASTTVVNKRLRELFQWNAVISKWECVGITSST